MGFKIKDNELVKYKQEKGVTDVVIPDGVTEIGKEAFWGCSKITSVTIPDSMEVIFGSAFWDCNKLETIILSNGFIESGEYEFFQKYIGKHIKDYFKVIPKYIYLNNNPISDWKDTKSKHKAVKGFARQLAEGFEFAADILETNMKYIRSQSKKLIPVAANDEYLLKLMIAEKLITVEDFDTLLDSVENSELKAILIDYSDSVFSEKEKQKHYEKQLDVKFDPLEEIKKIWNYEEKDDGTIKINYYTGNEKVVVIPNVIGDKSVTELGEYAFSPKRKRIKAELKNLLKVLKEVTIPNSVSIIGKECFRECSGLEKIKISDKLTVIDEFAFCGCANLKSIHIPDSVAEIGKFAFEKCKLIEKIALPLSVTKINTCTFGGCSNLVEISGLDNVTEIDDFAFDGCKKLSAIDIPETVERIGWLAFNDTLWLKNKSGFVMGNSHLLYLYKGDESHIDIPDNVIEIGDWAFSYENLTSITIPDSVKKFGKNVFYDCKNLTITAPAGSFAIEYAKDEGIKYKEV
ncbi:MAG: leucine-rich repeat protein [Ruminococcus sp.]|nr:leucine-rich repeat protein [Ruminococcus sp.]